jgi:molecular chaperone DnaK
MVDEAKAHAEEDKALKEKIEIKNKADSMVYQTEKQLTENGDKLSDDIKAPVQAGIDKLKKALEADDTDEMKSVMEALEQDLMKFGQEIYQQEQAAQGGAEGAAPEGQAPNPGAENAAPKEDDFVDAEIIEDDK